MTGAVRQVGEPAAGGEEGEQGAGRACAPPLPRECDHPDVYSAERDPDGGARGDKDQDPGREHREAPSLTVLG